MMMSRVSATPPDIVEHWEDDEGTIIATTTRPGYRSHRLFKRPTGTRSKLRVRARTRLPLPQSRLRAR